MINCSVLQGPSLYFHRFERQAESKYCKAQCQAVDSNGAATNGEELCWDTQHYLKGKLIFRKSILLQESIICRVYLLMLN